MYTPVFRERPSANIHFAVDFRVIYDVSVYSLVESAMEVTNGIRQTCRLETLAVTLLLSTLEINGRHTGI
jgi:hypothetical protein